MPPESASNPCPRDPFEELHARSSPISFAVLQQQTRKHTRKHTHTHIDIKCTPCHGLEDGILTGGERELARQQDVENDP